MNNVSKEPLNELNAPSLEGGGGQVLFKQALGHRLRSLHVQAA